ncbi:permease prefix domain 1-containing protein [Streptosporangium sp. NPDC004379]|uniref:permease prefix domain 1-containing protein n=1 Tax=Streptosporangium sp. NPDC004379 TaxID=3366189 RepID=UPI003676C9BA
MANAGVIDDYVTRLGRTLKGPPGPKRDMITEARDSLVDTAEALEDGGLDRAEAERVAVEEFGGIDEIAPAYQERLAVSAGRRLAALLFVSVPLTCLMWGVIWKFFPGDPAGYVSRPGWFGPVARAVDLIQVFVGLLGGVALFALGRGLRRLRRPRFVIRSLAALVWVMLPTVGVLSLALTYGSHNAGGFPVYGTAAALVSDALSLVQLYGAVRCMRVTRRRLAIA